MKSVIFIFLLFYVNCYLTVAQPVFNPYTDKYDTCPSWVNELEWANVINIKSLATNPATWDSIAVVAIKSLYAQGGGVLYFPAGTYFFANDLKLLSGVLLRGDKPLCNNAKSDSFAPPSRLVFPAYIPAFSGSGTANSTAFKRIYSDSIRNNIAIVFLDINRGRISIGVDGKNVLVFGVRQNNIAQPDPYIPTNYPRMESWQRFSYMFTSNISVSVNENGSIVNNRANDFMNNKFNPVPDESYDQPGYVAYGKYKYNVGDVAKEFPYGVTKYTGAVDVTTDTTHISRGSWARFNYTDHYGIRLNGKYYEPYTTAVEPDEKLEVIDNWIYTTMRVGYFVKGYGQVVRGNVKKDQLNKRVYLHALGWELARNNAATYENRGMNFSGHNVLIENNDFEVYRHAIIWSGFSSVDGEGILTPESVDPYKKVDGIYILNNKVNAYIGLFWMNDIKDVHIAKNNLVNSGYIYVVAKNSVDHRLDKCIIDSNYNITGITARGAEGTTDLQIFGNSGTGEIDHTCSAQLWSNGTLTDKLVCSSTAAPQPKTLLPFAGERNVNINAVVSITWDNPVTVLDLSGITLVGDSTGLLAGISSSLSGDGRTLTITHPIFTHANDWYTVTIPANALTNAGGGNVLINWWRFNIQAKPYARTLAPSNGAYGIDATSEVLIEFSQFVQLLSTNGIVIYDPSNNEIQNAIYSWNAIKNMLLIGHANFDALGTYRVVVPAAAFKNASGLFNDSIIWEFSTASIITNVGDAKQNIEFNIYPNPTLDILNINTPTEDVHFITILNSNGVSVFTSKIEGSINMIDVSKFSSGIYILLMQNDLGFVSKHFCKY